MTTNRSPVAPDRGLEGADVLAVLLRKGVAEPVALEHPAEPEALLLFARRDPDGVQRREMVLRDLADRGIGGRDDGDHLGQGGEADARAAVGFGHRDAPKAGARKAVEFGRREVPLAVACRGIDRELGREFVGDADRFLVGCDTVRVRIAVEAGVAVRLMGQSIPRHRRLRLPKRPCP